MRIAVVMMTGGGLSGGPAKYLHELLPRLNHHPDVESCHVFVPAGVASAVTAEEVRLHTTSPRLFFRGVGAEEIKRIASPDVVFITTARWADFGTIPTVVTVRNMEPLINPVRN